MAKSQLQFKRTTTDKVSIRGYLFEDCETIEYEDDNKIVKEVKIKDLLNAFKNQDIDLSISLKSEEDLDIIPNNNK